MSANLMNLIEYVRAHAQRGACKCGKCADQVPDPNSAQPNGHTVNMTFFEVAQDGTATAEEFRALVMAEYPDWLNGAEHNYLKIGAEMGDQGLAIMTIGLGHLLGVWRALTPDIVMASLPASLKTKMAESGMIALIYDDRVKAGVPS